MSHTANVAGILILAERAWHLGDVAGDAPSFIKGQRLGDSCITRIGVAVDIGDGLVVAVYDLEAAVWASTVHGAGNRLINGLDRASFQGFLKPSISS